MSKITLIKVQISSIYHFEKENSGFQYFLFGLLFLPLPSILESGQICMLATTEKNAKNHWVGYCTSNHFSLSDR
jgi:hypothetical protein